MATLVLLLLINSITLQSVKTNYCLSTEEQQCTTWEDTDTVRDFRLKPVQDINGKVLDFNFRLISGVLVEIYEYEFDLTDPVPPRWNHNIECHKRLAACITDETGRFAFKLPSGCYELRASKHAFNATSILTTINAKKGKKKNTDIIMHIS
jgi:hypothetical protein